jgi:hypothetical protein
MSVIGAVATIAVLLSQSVPAAEIRLDEDSDKCARQEARESGRGAGSGSSHAGVAVQPPLVVSLAGTDRTDYVAGDRITFTVILTNVSTAPLAIPVLPTSQVCTEVREQYDRLGRAEIQLRTRSQTSRTALIGVAVLWSTASKPESRRILQPGQSVRIDVSRPWAPLHAPDGIPDPARLFIRAEGFGTQAVDSNNEVIVRTRPAVAR